jgi:spore germination cell wall hydrolase CwlJ-like protein
MLRIRSNQPAAMMRIQMRFANRAGGFAAAIFLLSVGIVNPTPSRAWEVNIPNGATPTPVPALVAPTVETAPSSTTPVAPAAETAPVADAVPAIAAEPRQIAAPRRSLAQAVEAYAAGAASDAEQDCLATAVYFEANGEPLRGQLAVAQVILNRIHSGRFASSVCGVVKQRGQFSFVRGGHLPSAPRASAGWRKAVAVARLAVEGTSERPAANALFFHARRVSVGWHAIRVASIGNHLFYR